MTGSSASGPETLYSTEQLTLSDGRCASIQQLTIFTGHSNGELHGRVKWAGCFSVRKTSYRMSLCSKPPTSLGRCTDSEGACCSATRRDSRVRSEEHTSE